MQTSEKGEAEFLEDYRLIKRAHPLGGLQLALYIHAQNPARDPARTEALVDLARAIRFSTLLKVALVADFLSDYGLTLLAAADMVSALEGG